MVSYMSYDIDEMVDPDSGPKPEFTECMELVDAMKDSGQQLVKKNEDCMRGDFV